MKCNRCNRRCKGLNTLQEAKQCGYFREPRYRERRMIDHLNDNEIIALHKLYQLLPA